MHMLNFFDTDQFTVELFWSVITESSIVIIEPIQAYWRSRELNSLRLRHRHLNVFRGKLVDSHRYRLTF